MVLAPAQVLPAFGSQAYVRCLLWQAREMHRRTRMRRQAACRR